MTSPAQHTTPPTVLLIPGHWLGAWAWDDVVARLTADGVHALPMSLPGLDPDDPHRASRTLDEQAAAVEAEVEAQGGDVVLVAHSGANAPVSLVLDRHPALIRRVVWVDSGPLAPGTVFAPDLPDAVDEIPLPAFDVLAQQASLDGLTPEHLERFRTRAVPQPGAQVLELARSGHPMFAEVDRLTKVDVVDVPTGHWPMWSRPEDLAGVIRDVVATDA